MYPHCVSVAVTNNARGRFASHISEYHLSVVIAHYSSVHIFFSIKGQHLVLTSWFCIIRQSPSIMVEANNESQHIFSPENTMLEMREAITCYQGKKSFSDPYRCV